MSRTRRETTTEPLEHHPLFDGGDPQTADGAAPTEDLEPENFDFDEEADFEEESLSEPEEAYHDWQDPAPGGKGLCILGALITLAGLACGVVMTSRPEMLGGMVKFFETAFGPGFIALSGVALMAAGFAVRASRGSGEETAHVMDALARTEHALTQLGAGQPAIDGDDLPRALLLLQRVDEKINNLSKAIKMYGKPLVELGNASADTLGALREIQATMASHSESEQDHRVENANATTENFGRVEGLIRDLGDRSSADATVAKMQEALTQLEESLSKRNGSELEDLRKAATNIEDLEKATASCMADLERSTNERLQRLEDSLSTASKDMVSRLERVEESAGAKIELPEFPEMPTLPDYDESFRGIQRELESLATGLSSIQAQLKRGGAPTPAPAAAPAAAAPTQAAEPAAAAPTETGGGKPPGGLAQSIAGTGKAKGGKNVLGAIAKLKSMRN